MLAIVSCKLYIAAETGIYWPTLLEVCVAGLTVRL